MEEVVVLVVGCVIGLVVTFAKGQHRENVVRFYERHGGK